MCFRCPRSLGLLHESLLAKSPWHFLVRKHTLETGCLVDDHMRNTCSNRRKHVANEPFHIDLDN